MSDFDPTTNRIPFGLLSEDEQTSLLHWPHGFEFWWDEERKWDQVMPSWESDIVYRGNPAPAVTSKWFNVYPQWPSPSGKSTRKVADEFSQEGRIAVLRIDTCNGVSTAHLEEV